MVKLPIYPTCGCHLPAGSLKQPFWRKELLSNPLEWQGICLLQGWSISLFFSPSKVPPMPANTSSQVQGCNENSGEIWYVSTISYVVIWGRSNMLLLFCESCFCIWDYLGFSQTMWKGRGKNKQTWLWKLPRFRQVCLNLLGVSNVSNGCSNTILLQRVRGKTYTQRESQLWPTESSTFLLVFFGSIHKVTTICT